MSIGFDIIRSLRIVIVGVKTFVVNGWFCDVFEGEWVLEDAAANHYAVNAVLFS